jgi:hypothetical protein
MRITGLLNIVFDDLGATERTAYATLAVNLDVETEELERAAADEYGPREWLPGQQSWSGSSSHNEVVESNMARNVAQQALEELANSRAIFSCTIESPSGTSYEGRAWISSYQIMGGDQQVFRASAQFVGVGELAVVAAVT